MTARTVKPSLYVPVESASTPATIGPTVIPTIMIMDENPMIIPNDLRPK